VTDPGRTGHRSGGHDRRKIVELALGPSHLERAVALDRDAHLCVYCGVRADTIDHVRPRSRGGLHTWTNVVGACARCNHRKGDRLLSELGWHLAVAPIQPPATVAVVMGWAKRDPAWQRYLAWNDLGIGIAPAV